MEDVFASLKEMEWEPIPPEDFIARCGRNYPWWNNGLEEIQSKQKPDGFAKGRLPGQKRSTWKNERYWWNNGTDETLQEKCPNGWKRGRLLENRKKWKAQKGSGCGQKPGNFLILFDDGSEIQIKGLKPWCKNNNYSYTSILNLRSGKLQKHKDIVAVEKLSISS